MDTSQLKNVDYPFDIVALSGSNSGTHTLLIVPTEWLRNCNISPQSIYDNDEQHQELYDQLMAFPEIEMFHNVVTYD